MRIWKTDDFKDKTPAISDATRQWMEDFITTLGESIHEKLGWSVEYEVLLDVIPGVEVSGFIPLTNGGLRLTMMAQLEADADYSHYPAFPCVRDKLDELSADLEDAFMQAKGASINDAPEDVYYEFLKDWNNSCDAYVDYVIEVWQNMDKVQMQAYVSLDRERTAVRNTWFVDELSDFEQAAKDIKPIIMAAWERMI